MTTLTPEPRERAVAPRRPRPERVPAEAVAQVRAFSRFFTNRWSVRRVLDTQVPLTHARVLCELAQADAMAMADLRQALDIDGGQLSRVLSALVGDGLVRRAPAPDDARRQVLSLTAAGRRAAALLDARIKERITAHLARLAPTEVRELGAAMATVRRLLSDRPAHPTLASPRPKITLRAPKAGDLGWIVERHGALYAAEYGWNQEFEALVAEIVADYAHHAAKGRARAWIAELDGQRVGSVACVGVDDTTAMLRLLLVDPSARGHGVGRHLVQTCIDHARAVGYRRLALRTNDCLTAARRIYEEKGFELLYSQPHQTFGTSLVHETWERAL